MTFLCLLVGLEAHFMILEVIILEIVIVIVGAIEIGLLLAEATCQLGGKILIHGCYYNLQTTIPAAGSKAIRL